MPDSCVLYAAEQRRVAVATFDELAELAGSSGCRFDQ